MINDQTALLDAVAAWYDRRYGVKLDPQTEICSLLGSQEGLAHIALSIVDEGDIVLVPDPCYPVFGDGPRIAGATLYYMPQKKENGYVIDQFENIIVKKTPNYRNITAFVILILVLFMKPQGLLGKKVLKKV